MTLPPPPSPDCVSDLRLDQLRVAELSDAQATAIREHLSNCAECHQRYALLCEDAARFGQHGPSFEKLISGAASQLRTADPQAARSLPSRCQPSATSRRFAIWASFAAAAGLVLLIAQGLREQERGAQSIPTSNASSELATERTKGASASFDFVVRRGEHTVLGIAGMALYPGDRLRFTVSASRAMHWGVWGVDAGGQVSAYATSARLMQVSAGRQVALPQTVELDDSAGHEHIVAVFCEGAQASDTIQRALADNIQAPRLPPGCGSETVEVRKALR
jgi:hypothetical protein